MHDDVKERLRRWLASPEGRTALDRTLEGLKRIAAELKVERKLDERAAERPMDV